MVPGCADARPEGLVLALLRDVPGDECRGFHFASLAAVFVGGIACHDLLLLLVVLDTPSQDRANERTTFCVFLRWLFCQLLGCLVRRGKIFVILCEHAFVFANDLRIRTSRSLGVVISGTRPC